MSDKIDALESLAAELYQEGYLCGISDDTWFRAWALAMSEVAAGAPYTSDMVIQHYQRLKEHS